MPLASPHFVAMFKVEAEHIGPRTEAAVSDRTKLPELSADENLVRIDEETLDLNRVLVVDPAVLHADSDPMAEWVRATTEGIGNMTADEWTAWISEFQLVAA